MPNFSRLELKPSPREFDILVFNQYYTELKEDKVRLKLFLVILKARNFEDLRKFNIHDKEKGQTEINQCLIEALDIALHTPDDELDEEFESFDQKFHIDTSKYVSPITLNNKIFI